MNERQHITITKCPCGHPSCSDYHLVGVGKFVQGSGFDRHEADLIARLLNEHTTELAEMKD